MILKCLVFFWATSFHQDSYKTKLSCYTFLLASFYRNPDYRKSNLIEGRFEINMRLKKIVEKNQTKTNRSDLSSNIPFAMLTQHLHILLSLELKKSRFTIQIKRINQRNTRTTTCVCRPSLPCIF